MIVFTPDGTERNAEATRKPRQVIIQRLIIEAAVPSDAKIVRIIAVEALAKASLQP